jgi:hypothetical protein
MGSETAITANLAMIGRFEVESGLAALWFRKAQGCRS